MTWTRQQRSTLAISLMMLAITAVMYLAEGSWTAAPVLRYLYLIPVAQAALTFGLSGSMIVALLADLLFAPLVAVSLARYGLLAGQTVEILITLALLPLLAYFAGSGWGRLSRQRELYQFLSGMGDLFGLSLPRNELLAQILEQGANLIGAAGGEIVLIEGERAEQAARWGLAGYPLADGQPAVSYARSLARYVIEQNELWQSTDLDSDPSFVRIGAGPEIESILAMPLRLAGRPVGALAFYNRPGGFGASERAAVEAIGSKVEVSLEHFRHMDEQAQRQRLQRELDLAADVQARFLPTSVPAIPGYELAGQSLPAREVGGDFFTFLALPGGRWYIAVGDVSGKGVVGAFFMAIATNLTEMHLQGYSAGAGRSLLGEMNDLLQPRMAPQQINTALAYALLDPATGAIQLGNAGLIAPLLCRGDGSCAYVDVYGLPLGAVPGATYGEATLTLRPGETLILVSDGVVEARGAGGQLFGLEALQALVCSQTGSSASELAATIIARSETFTEGEDLHDDMTVVVLRRLAP